MAATSRFTCYDLLTLLFLRFITTTYEFHYLKWYFHGHYGSTDFFIIWEIHSKCWNMDTKFPKAHEIIYFTDLKRNLVHSSSKWTFICGSFDRNLHQLQSSVKKKSVLVVDKQEFIIKLRKFPSLRKHWKENTFILFLYNKWGAQFNKLKTQDEHEISRWEKKSNCYK